MRNISTTTTNNFMTKKAAGKRGFVWLMVLLLAVTSVLSAAIFAITGDKASAATGNEGLAEARAVGTAWDNYLANTSNYPAKDDVVQITIPELTTLFYRMTDSFDTAALNSTFGRTLVGSATQGIPYNYVIIINTANDLVRMSYFCEGRISYNDGFTNAAVATGVQEFCINANYMLGNNIDMLGRGNKTYYASVSATAATGNIDKLNTSSAAVYSKNEEDFNPIGKTGAAFKGVFDGQNFEISNIKINTLDASAYYGMFARNEGLIQNFGVRNMTANFNNTAAASMFGAIVAHNEGAVRFVYANGVNINNPGNVLYANGNILSPVYENKAGTASDYAAELYCNYYKIDGADPTQSYIDDIDKSPTGKTVFSKFSAIGKSMSGQLTYSGGKIRENLYFEGTDGTTHARKWHVSGTTVDTSLVSNEISLTYGYGYTCLSALYRSGAANWVQIMRPADLVAMAEASYENYGGYHHRIMNDLNMQYVWEYAILPLSSRINTSQFAGRLFSTTGAATVTAATVNTTPANNKTIAYLKMTGGAFLQVGTTYYASYGLIHNRENYTDALYANINFIGCEVKPVDLAYIPVGANLYAGILGGYTRGYHASIYSNSDVELDSDGNIGATLYNLIYVGGISGYLHTYSHADNARTNLCGVTYVANSGKVSGLPFNLYGSYNTGARVGGIAGYVYIPNANSDFYKVYSSAVVKGMTAVTGTIEYTYYMSGYVGGLIGHFSSNVEESPNIRMSGAFEGTVCGEYADGSYKAMLHSGMYVGGCIGYAERMFVANGFGSYPSAEVIPYPERKEIYEKSNTSGSSPAWRETSYSVGLVIGYSSNLSRYNLPSGVSMYTPQTEGTIITKEERGWPKNVYVAPYIGRFSGYCRYISNIYNKTDLSVLLTNVKTSYVSGVTSNTAANNSVNDGNITVELDYSDYDASFDPYRSNGSVYVQGISNNTNTVSGEMPEIANCVNNGNITVKGRGGQHKFWANVLRVGGVTSYSAGASNCINTGKIDLSAASGNVAVSAAGILAYLYTGVVESYLRGITNCINIGDVTAGSGLTYARYVGGVLGYYAASSSTVSEATVYHSPQMISGCVNTGSISSATIASDSTNHVGGIAGCHSNGSIIDCVNSGNVSGGRNAGGVVGYANFSQSLATHNVEAYAAGLLNYGAVSGYFSSGGIFGYAVGGVNRLGKAGVVGNGMASISSVINYGTVSTTAPDGTAIYAGGIMGVANTALNMELAVNYGSVTVSTGTNAGSISGSVTANSKLNMCISITEASIFWIGSGRSSINSTATRENCFAANRAGTTAETHTGLTYYTIAAIYDLENAALPDALKPLKDYTYDYITTDYPGAVFTHAGAQLVWSAHPYDPQHSTVTVDNCFAATSTLGRRTGLYVEDIFDASVLSLLSGTAGSSKVSTIQAALTGHTQLKASRDTFFILDRDIVFYDSDDTKTHQDFPEASFLPDVDEPLNPRKGSVTIYVNQVDQYITQNGEPLTFDAVDLALRIEGELRSISENAIVTGFTMDPTPLGFSTENISGYVGYNVVAAKGIVTIAQMLGQEVVATSEYEVYVYFINTIDIRIDTLILDDSEASGKGILETAPLVVGGLENEKIVDELKLKSDDTAQVVKFDGSTLTGNIALQGISRQVAESAAVNLYYTGTQYFGSSDPGLVGNNTFVDIPLTYNNLNNWAVETEYVLGTPSSIGDIEVSNATLTYIIRLTAFFTDTGDLQLMELPYGWYRIVIRFDMGGDGASDYIYNINFFKEKSGDAMLHRVTGSGLGEPNRPRVATYVINSTVTSYYYYRRVNVTMANTYNSMSYSSPGRFYANDETLEKTVDIGIAGHFAGFLRPDVIKATDPLGVISPKPYANPLVDYLFAQGAISDTSAYGATVQNVKITYRQAQIGNIESVLEFDIQTEQDDWVVHHRINFRSTATTYTQTTYLNNMFGERESGTPTVSRASGTEVYFTTEYLNNLTYAFSDMLMEETLDKVRWALDENDTFVPWESAGLEIVPPTFTGVESILATEERDDGGQFLRVRFTVGDEEQGIPATSGGIYEITPVARLRVALWAGTGTMAGKLYIFGNNGAGVTKYIHELTYDTALVTLAFEELNEGYDESDPTSQRYVTINPVVDHKPDLDNAQQYALDEAIAFRPVPYELATFTIQKVASNMCYLKDLFYTVAPNGVNLKQNVDNAYVSIPNTVTLSGNNATLTYLSLEGTNAINPIHRDRIKNFQVESIYGSGDDDDRTYNTYVEIILTDASDNNRNDLLTTIVGGTVDEAGKVTYDMPMTYVETVGEDGVTRHTYTFMLNEGDTFYVRVVAENNIYYTDYQFYSKGPIRNKTIRLTIKADKDMTPGIYFFTIHTVTIDELTDEVKYSRPATVAFIIPSGAGESGDYVAELDEDGNYYSKIYILTDYITTDYVFTYSGADDTYYQLHSVSATPSSYRFYEDGSGMKLISEARMTIDVEIEIKGGLKSPWGARA